MKPQPRPALKRAEDADLHPALSVAPAQLPTQLARDLGSAPVEKASAGKKGKKPKKPFQSAGQATSDSLRNKTDRNTRPVKLGARVPKKIRKEIEAIAKHSGTSVDAIVTQALTDWLGDPRRW